VVGERVHARDQSVPQSPQVGKRKPYLDSVPARSVEVTRGEDLLPEVDEPLDLHRQLRPRHVEQGDEERPPNGIAPAGERRRRPGRPHAGSAFAEHRRLKRGWIMLLARRSAGSPESRRERVDTGTTAVR